MQFAAETTQLLLDAAHFSRCMGHSYVGSQHLLLALAQNGWTGQILSGSGGERWLLEDLTVSLYGTGCGSLPSGCGAMFRAKLPPFATISTKIFKICLALL